MTDTLARMTDQKPQTSGPNLLMRHSQHSWNIRTDYLTASHVTKVRRWDRLCGCSPHTTWRQSCHSNQMPRVMPGTAATADGYDGKRPGNRKREILYSGEGQRACEVKRLSEVR